MITSMLETWKIGINILEKRIVRQVVYLQELKHIWIIYTDFLNVILMYF
jgi:hypothetical protein